MGYIRKISKEIPQNGCARVWGVPSLSLLYLFWVGMGAQSVIQVNEVKIFGIWKMIRHNIKLRFSRKNSCH